MNCPVDGGSQRVVYESDTVIQGLDFQVLSVTQTVVYLGNPNVTSSYELPPILLHTNGDTVYYLADDELHVLFNFDTQVGDTIPARYDPNWGQLECSNSTLKVDSVGAINISGFELNWYAPSNLDTLSGVDYHGRINDRFGPMDGFFSPVARSCSESEVIDDCLYSLMCYQDSSSFVYSASSIGCFTTGITVNETEQPIGVYPNPVV
jgi:hypothetical protein